MGVVKCFFPCWVKRPIFRGDAGLVSQRVLIYSGFSPTLKTAPTKRLQLFQNDLVFVATFKRKVVSGFQNKRFFQQSRGVSEQKQPHILPQLPKSTTSIGVSTHMAPTMEDDDAKRARLRRRDEPQK